MRIGPLMALAGAALLWGSLTLVWFSHDLTAYLLQQRPLETPTNAVVERTGWQSFRYTDIALGTLSVLAAITVLFDWFAPRPDGRTTFTIFGVIGIGVVLNEMIWRPNFEPTVTPHIEMGAWLALIGCVLIAWGGRVDPVQPSTVLRRHRQPVLH